MPYVILSLGANISGKYGHPIESFLKTIDALTDYNIKPIFISSPYLSVAIGAHYQPSYYNCVMLSNTYCHSNKLLKIIKQLERASGRSGQLYWGARPLDIDIIDFNGEIKNWSNKKLLSKSFKKWRQSKILPLTYPHKAMHKRAFVLKPLIEILPTWRHPVFGLKASHLMANNCSPLTIKATQRLDISLDL